MGAVIGGRHVWIEVQLKAFCVCCPSVPTTLFPSMRIALLSPLLTPTLKRTTNNLPSSLFKLLDKYD